MEALRVCEAWPDVEQAAVFGDALHISVARDNADVAAWQRRFSDAGLPVTNVRPVDVTLEDVFVSLVAAEDRAGTAPASS
jgi:hypothetical protein